MISDGYLGQHGAETLKIYNKRFGIQLAWKRNMEIKVLMGAAIGQYGLSFVCGIPIISGAMPRAAQESRFNHTHGMAI